MPRSMARSTSARASSGVTLPHQSRPSVHAPKPISDTSTPERPSVRLPIPTSEVTGRFYLLSPSPRPKGVEANGKRLHALAAGEQAPEDPRHHRDGGGPGQTRGDDDREQTGNGRLGALEFVWTIRLAWFGHARRDLR